MKLTRCYRYIENSSHRTHRVVEIDAFMGLMCESILDNFEMQSDGDHDAYTHPETILTRTAFGSAYCDGYTMHQRYILMLKTMYVHVTMLFL